MDDILIFSTNLEDHHHQTIQVLEILGDADFFLKPSKCSFDREEIDYLGLIIQHQHIGMDSIKVQGIQH